MGLWVDPDARGTGVARALVDTVERWAVQDGATTISLWVVQDADAARATYLRLGFAPSGETMAMPRDPSRTEERYVRRLGDPAIDRD